VDPKRLSATRFNPLRKASSCGLPPYVFAFTMKLGGRNAVKESAARCFHELPPGTLQDLAIITNWL
jgi:hypothetical protein